MKTTCHAPCCHSHHHIDDQVLYRAILFLVIGVLLFIPYFEFWMVSSLSGRFILLLMATTSAYTIYHDFAELRWYSIGITLTLSLALVSPLVTTYSYFLISLSILFSMVLLLSGNNSNEQQKQSPIMAKAASFAPSSGKTILLFIALNWLTSLASMTPFGAGIFHFALHDSMIILGVYQLSSWIRSKYTTIPSSNDGKTLTVITQTKNGVKEKLLHEIKAGDVINIEMTINRNNLAHLLLPISCYLAENQSCMFRDDAAEKNVRKTFNGNGINNLSAYTTYHKGVITCLEDFNIDAVKPNFNQQDQSYLSWFLTLSLLIAFGIALYQGILTGSLLISLQSFSINLSLLCPCVFFTIKPIIQHQASSAIKKLGFHIHRMPQIGQPDKIVWDRTHTLYHEVKGKNDYQLYSNTVNWMQSLSKIIGKNNMYIISGHGTGDDWERHLEDCRSTFKTCIEPNNIIFDRQYHSHDYGGKDIIIKSLQLHGQIEAQPSTTKSYTVCMVGDGMNDKHAMSQANLSICVAKGIAHNHNKRHQWETPVTHQAHFSAHPKTLKNISYLFNILQQKNRQIKHCITFSLSMSLLILGLYNGGLKLALNITMSAGMACSIMSLSCLVMLIYVSNIDFKLPKISTDNGVQSNNSVCSSHYNCKNHDVGNPCQCTHHEKLQKNSVNKTFKRKLGEKLKI